MALVKCMFCGMDISNKAIACIHCGHQVTTYTSGSYGQIADYIKCPDCGKECSSLAITCVNCGFPLNTIRRRLKTESDVLVDEAKLLYFHRKYIKAWDKCQLAVEMKNPEAYFMTGFLLARNHHGWKNVKDAITWYTKAAEKNNAAAINAIGVMHFKGNQLPQDTENAISHFKRASDLGDIFAPYNLARCYEHGIGVTQDRNKAIKMFYLSIDRGNKYAGEYFETKFFCNNATKTTTEDETDCDLCGYVFSEEHWGYLEKTTRIGKNTSTILLPIYSSDYYKKNEKFIREYEENYRRKQMFKLPELIIME